MSSEGQPMPVEFREAIDGLPKPLAEWLTLPDNFKRYLPVLFYKVGKLLLPSRLYELDDLVDQPKFSIGGLAHKLDIAECRGGVHWPKEELKLAASFAVWDFSMEGLLVDRGGNVRIPPLNEGSVFYFYPGSEALACAHELLAGLGEVAGIDRDQVDWHRRHASVLRRQQS